MRTPLLALALWPSLAAAGVLNVEFKFTPFTGDAKADHVESVPGTARVLLNGVPFAEQPVQQQTLPVMFDEREVASAVWVPVASMGPAVRKGKNTIRVEFEPNDPKLAYTAQLRWASVTDQVREEGTRSTNQADEGVESKPATGPITLERTFTADFAKDQPWHHYHAVTTLTDADKEQLAKLAGERVGWFTPPFAAIYKALDGQEGVKVAEVRKAKCLDATQPECGSRRRPRTSSTSSRPAVPRWSSGARTARRSTCRIRPRSRRSRATRSRCAPAWPSWRCSRRGSSP
jgi:hypothetical protein